MFGLRKTMGSIFLAVFFLALAYTAMVFYNVDKSQQEKIINNDLVQKGKTAIETAVSVSEKLGTTQPSRNVVLENKVTSIIKDTDWRGLINRLSATSSETENGDALIPEEGIVINESEKAAGFWTKITTWAKNEWESSRNEQEVAPITIQEITNQKFINYEKTDSGAEIIFRPENEQEYKLPLPFKFLRNNSNK